MKKYLIMILVLLLVGSSSAHAELPGVQAIDHVYYRFDKSLKSNKYFVEIINFSIETLTFQSGGDGNYLTLQDGTVVTLTEPGSKVRPEAVAIKSGDQRTLTFHISDDNFKNAKTVTVTGEKKGKKFKVNYDVPAKETTVEDLGE